MTPDLTALPHGLALAVEAQEPGGRIETALAICRASGLTDRARSAHVLAAGLGAAQHVERLASATPAEVWHWAHLVASIVRGAR
jgi:hypothetical protein